MSKIIIKDDDFESVLIVGEEEDEEFYDFLTGLIDAYDEDGMIGVRDYLEKLEFTHD